MAPDAGRSRPALPGAPSTAAIAWDRWTARGPGSTLYDWFAGRGRPRRRTRWLAPARRWRSSPTSSRSGLARRGTLPDAVMDDARLAVAVARDAAAHGARHPHLHRGDRRAAGATDGSVELLAATALGGRRALAARAARVVNAAGPWADAVRPCCRSPLAARRAGSRRRCCAHRAASTSSSRALTHGHGLLVSARADGRVFFVVPFGGRSLVGTTEVEVASPARARRVARERRGESRYLRAELRGACCRASARHAAARGARRAAAAAALRTATSAARRASTAWSRSGPMITVGGRQVHDVPRAWRATRSSASRGGSAASAPAARSTRSSRCPAPLAPDARRSSASRSSRSSTSSRAASSDVDAPPHDAVARARSRARRGAAHRARRWRARSAGRRARRARSSRATTPRCGRRSRCCQRAAGGGRHERLVRSGDRPGHHRHHRAAARPRRRACAARGYAELPAALPAAGMGRARRRGDLATRAARGPRRRCAAARPARARSRRSASPTSARPRCCGTARRGTPVAPRDRVAGPAHADRCAALLKRRALERDGAARTGLVLDPYFSATKLEWLLRHVPGLRARARRGELAFGTVDSWLLWKLTGGARARHRSHQRLAHAALRHRAPALGRRAARGASACRRAVLPEVRAVERRRSARTRGAGSLPDGDSDRRHRRRPAGRAVRAGLRRAPASRRTPTAPAASCCSTPASGAVASRAGLLTTIACGAARRAGLRARGQRVHRRRGASSGCATASAILKRAGDSEAIGALA